MNSPADVPQNLVDTHFNNKGKAVAATGQIQMMHGSNQPMGEEAAGHLDPMGGAWEGAKQTPPS